jgi:NAD(P)-dependent dehydrogenase (short-subunit alcohol dehydrogenase family)
MKGELAVVTGANRGLGFEVCRQLAERGLRVILAGRKADQAAAAADKLAARGLPVEGRALDVTSAEQVHAFAARLAADGTPVHALVNNAGVSLDGFDAGVAARTLAVNYFGAAAVTDALLPLVPRGGRVVMVSSGMGELSVVGSELRARFGAEDLDRAALDALMRSFVDDVASGAYRGRGWPSNAYSVSKVGLNALTRVLARAPEARGRLVNAVCPGWVRTDMGGASAPRSIEQGAAGIVWAATLSPDGPTGGFFRDGRAIAW